MGEIIIANAVARRPNFLYYIDGEGNICEAEMSKKGRPRKVVKEKTCQ